MDSLRQLFKSRVNTHLPVVNRLLNSSANNITCKLCNSEVPQCQLLTHFENYHIDFDHSLQCLVCLASFDDYERHVYLCVNGETIPETNSDEDHVKDAITVLRCYRPHSWYHVIMSRDCLPELLKASQDLEDGDFEMADFRCWCKSKNAFELNEVSPVADHVHVLMRIQAFDKWQYIWTQRLVTGYKKMIAIEDIIHFVQVLISLSQTKVCDGEFNHDEERHYHCSRFIPPRDEYIIKLYFPEALFNEIECVTKLVGPGYFDILKTIDDNIVVYNSLLTHVLEKLDFGTMPLLQGRCQVVDKVAATDRVLMWIDNKSAVILEEQGTEMLCIKDVLEVAIPEAIMIWTGRMHNVVHDIFQYVQRERSGRCISCGTE